MKKKARRSISALLSVALLFSFSARGERVSAGAEYSRRAEEIATDDAVAAARISTVLPECSDGEISLGSRLWELLAGESVAVSQSSDRPTLIVGGCVFGTRIKGSTVTVSSSEDGSPLREGDKIISIDKKTVHSISDIKAILKECDGSSLTLLCKRGGKSITLKCTPKLVEGEYKLGITLREGAAGIGTVTYIDPASGEFGGLGHGICDPDDGSIIEMTGGSVTDVILGGVVKGEAGKPGELSGILTDRPMGEIYSNTDCGVFGKLTATPRGAKSTLLPIAYRSEVKAGAATIISTLKNGKTMEYKIEISDVKPSEVGTKCFRIKITDPALIAVSGGIVRGMSGSPIIQDGKLVGAVTHVLVDDPCSGYGIFIENMLSAAKGCALPKAA